MTTLKIPKFRSAERAVEFAVKHNMVLDEQTEKLISQDAEASFKYANLVKGRFELGEPAISKNLQLSIYYAEYVLKGRFHLAENLIAESITRTERSPYIGGSIAFRYAREICKGSFEILEKLIINDPELCYEYAENVLGRRWEEAEPTIAKNVKFASKYAQKVIKGRFELAEPLISEDAENSFDYAVYAINNLCCYSDIDRSIFSGSRFEFGELAISKNEIILSRYIDLTKQELTGHIHNMMIARSLTGDSVAGKYFKYVACSKKRLTESLKKYPENMTVKEILQSL